MPLHTDNIPTELRAQPLWLQFYLSPDPKKPDKKPRKHPEVKYATPEDRKANLRSLDYLIANRTLRKGGGYQRYIVKNEGFTFVDIDHVRDAKTGEVERWALDLITWLDTYTEISQSGEGFHLVCRGSLPEDFKFDSNRVEIYAGHTSNKLLAMTGDIYGLNYAIENRQAEVEQLLRRAKAGEFGEVTPSVSAIEWRSRFHTVDELPDGDITFLIENVLPPGVAFIGALSGAGKTWFCLSMARALTTGNKFLGHWSVSEVVNVLYLCPEMGAKTFKKRCRRYGIKEHFYCQTIADGAPLNLHDEYLAAAIRELHPVVFLDTAIRFADVDDENSAGKNAQGMAKAIFGLIHLGARAVVGLHHRSKETARVEEMTLENVLRGTGDIGAMCDIVWGLQFARGNGDPQYMRESRKLVRLEVRCVKARDFSAPPDFCIQLERHIDQIGDMAIVADESTDTRAREIELLDRAITANTNIEKTTLEQQTGVGRNRQEKLAAGRGWIFDKHTKWTKKTTSLAPDECMLSCMHEAGS